MFSPMTPANAARARRLHAQLSELYLSGRVNSPTFNHYVLQFGVRMSTNVVRASSLDALEAVVRFASFLPENVFDAASAPVSEARLEEVKREFWALTGIDRQTRGSQPAATRLSHAGGAAATANNAVPSDPVTREFWQIIGLLPRA